MERNKPVVIDLSTDDEMTAEVAMDFPEDVIEDSQSAKVAVIGRKITLNYIFFSFLAKSAIFLVEFR